MPRKGREFEIINKALYELDKNKYTIKSPGYIVDKITNDEREVDVLLEYYDTNGCLRRIGIECRDRKSNQDVLWMEQLKSKRIDCELDYIIAVITSKFTEGAIKKARHYGIIIEEAEFFDFQKIENIAQNYNTDIFFTKFEVLTLNFLVDNKNKTLKELLADINFIDRMELLKFLNTECYFRVDFKEIAEESNIPQDMFFEHSENNYMIRKNVVTFNESVQSVIKRLHIKKMLIEFKIVPFKVSLPLNKGVATFDVDPKKNKKYLGIFGCDEEFVKFGYMDNNKMFLEIKVKDRKYYRIFGGNFKLNTITPNFQNRETVSNMKEIVEKMLGEFDLTKVI